MPKLLKILTYPNPILNLKAQPVKAIDNSITTLVEDMIYTMNQNNGIGLAANQVGVLLQIVVLNIEEVSDTISMPLVLINPKITYSSSETMEYEEGCLSFPELLVQSQRPNRVVVEYTDLNNQPQKIEAKGLTAICLQHELDHLNGYLFINQVSAVKKTVLLKKYKKMQTHKGSTS